MAKKKAAEKKMDNEKLPPFMKKGADKKGKDKDYGGKGMAKGKRGKSC